MSNDLTGRQWFVDTAASTVIWPSRVDIVQIEFTNYTGDTDTFVVKDATGRIVWEGNGAADLSPVRSGKIGWVDGVIVSTLSAGKLLFYIR